jgi:hypothetical protein
MRLVIVEQTGEYCTSEAQGKKVYYMIKSCLQMKDPLVIDCFRIRLMTTDFLDAAFGQLMKDINAEAFYAYIKFKLASTEIQNHIKFTVEHFHRYYRNASYRAKIDQYFNPEKNNIRLLEVKPRAEEIDIIDAERIPVYDIQPVDVRFLEGSYASPVGD